MLRKLSYNSFKEYAFYAQKIAHYASPQAHYARIIPQLQLKNPVP